MRKYWADLAATLFIYVATSLANGQVFRFPFDDEVYTLGLFHRQSFASLLLSYSWTNDVHPPLSYLLFFGLHHFGFSESAMRLVSLAMTSAALLIFQLLVLVWIERRNQRAPMVAARLIAVTLFGLSPLALSYGDALRWYPLFSLLVALFAAAYFLLPRHAMLAAGAILGIAGSTSLLALPVGAAFAAYRYGLQRRFRWQADLGFWLSAIVLGAFGFYSIAGIVFHRPQVVATQILLPPLISLPVDVLGFLGGERVGIGLAWLVIPAIVVIAMALLSAIDRKRADSPLHFLLLLVGTVVPLALAGFAKPRSFLYLAPAVSALLVFHLDRQIARASHARTLAMLAALLVLPAATLGNLHASVHPFKRELAIPYQEAIDFIRANRSGRVLVLSTDTVLAWALQGENESANQCIEFFLAAAAHCADRPALYDSIFIALGHMDKGNEAMMPRFMDIVARTTSGRERRAALELGIDRDAGLKRRLTGIPLREVILRVELYR